MAAVATRPKTADWAEDEELEAELPAPVETTDASTGITTIVSYKKDANGKTVKTTRRVRRKMQTSLVTHAAAERKSWTKFGEDKGKPAGFDRQTTIIGENIYFKPVAVSSKEQDKDKDGDAADDAPKAAGGKIVTCRLCKGNHMTFKCPFRDQLAALDQVEGEDEAAAGASTSKPPANGGKYVVPGRANNSAGESMFKRDDLPTLRIQSLSVDADEDDLRELFQTFGRVVRANVIKDRNTGESKGFGFVSFESRKDAEKALNKMNGHGYDSLILSVSWSQPREPRPA